MLVPVPLLLYVRNTGEMRRYRAFDVFFGVYALNFAVQTALALTGKYTLFQMLWVTHCLIIIAMVLGLTLLIREYRRKPSVEIRTCLSLFATAAALCAVSILLYVFAEYGAYQALSQTGILLFVLILLSVVTGELVQNLRYRTEAEIYHQMAEEDKLTHLQNRRAFDLRMQGIELGTEHCANAALVFMLQRRLKLGYARAARIVDQMEEIGVVGPFEGSKPRQVLITKEKWDEMRTQNGIGPRTEQVSFAEYEDSPSADWKDE